MYLLRLPTHFFCLFLLIDLLSNNYIGKFLNMLMLSQNTCHHWLSSNDFDICDLRGHEPVPMTVVCSQKHDTLISVLKFAC